MAKKPRLAKRIWRPEALTPDEIAAMADIGELAYAQMYQLMKAQGMSDERFAELWDAFG